MEQTKITALLTPGVGELVGARVGVIGAGVGATGCGVGPGTGARTGAGVTPTGDGVGAVTGAGVLLLLDLPDFLTFDFLDLEDLPLRDFSFLLL